MKRLLLLLLMLMMAALVLPVGAGAQWVRTSGPYHQVYTYGGDAFSPVVLGSKLLCLTEPPGVLLSTDSGTSWTLIGHGLSVRPNLLIARGSRLYLGSDSGLFVSVDTGISWQRIVILDPEPVVSAIAASGGNLIVGTAPDSVFCSTDGGTSWTPVLPLQVQSFASTGTILFAATAFQGIYQSTDHGLTWQAVDTTRRFVRAFIASGNNLYLSTDNGMLRSSDSGKTWSPASQGLPHAVVYALAADGTTLYASPWGDSLYSSTDSGANWHSTGNAGLTYPYIYYILSDGGNLYLGTAGGGLFHSTDQGANWTVHNPETTVFAAINHLDSANGKLFASTAAGLFITSDSGASWVPDSAGLGALTLTGVAAAGGRLFAATSNNGIFMSSNGGSWNALDSGLSPSPEITALLASNGRLYAGSKAGVFTSSDDGVSWANPHHAPPDVISLAAVGGRLIAGTSDVTIYYSTDSGVTWKASLSGPLSSNSGVLAVVGGIVFAGSNGEGIWRSIDSGVTWTVPAAPPENWSVTALASANGVLVAGTNYGAIYSSSDAGVHWKYAGVGFPEGKPVQAFAAFGGYFYAGTQDTGVWRIAVSNLTPSDVALSTADESSLTAYPNPATSTTTLRFTAPVDGNATVTVVNALGVSVMRNAYRVMRDASVTLDLSGLPSGMYECVVQIGGKKALRAPILVE